MTNFSRATWRISLRPLVAFCVGLAHGLAAMYFWAWLVPGGNPILRWFSTNLARNGHELAFTMAIYGHDILIGLLFALPFAFAVSRIGDEVVWKNLWIAFTGSVAILEWGLITDPAWLLDVVQMPSAYIGHAIMVFPFPLAFLAISKFKILQRSTATT